MSRRKQNQYSGWQKDKEVNLKDYFEVIKRRFWVIILVTVIATLGGYYYSITSAKDVSLYQTSTRLIIGADSDMSTLMVMIKDPIIMEKVKEELNLNRTSDSIANQIEVARIDESQVVKISVIDSNPKTAADIANATAQSFKTGIADILDFNNVQLLSAAGVNPIPINESKDRTVIIAFVFGLMTGIGLAFLLDSLDGTVRKESEVEEILGVPVLGSVSNMNKQKYAVKKSKEHVVEVRRETVDIK